MRFLDEDLERYAEQHSSEEDKVLQELSRETYLKVQMPNMLSGNLQGRFLEMVSIMLKPRRILEIGTFTGYSGISLAQGLTQDGLLYTIDVNEELQHMVARYVKQKNLSDKVKQFIGDARTIIGGLNEVFDLVFIDADKINYSNYYDLVFEKVRIGGYIIADNVLWSGKVLNEKKDKDTLAIDAYNKKVLADKRVESYILPLRDGLNIARRLA